MNTNNSATVAQPSGNVDRSSLNRGIALGAGGALLAAVVIGAASWFAVTRSGPAEQTNRMGAPVTLIGEATPGSTGYLAPNAAPQAPINTVAPAPVPAPVPAPLPAPVYQAQPPVAQLPPPVQTAQATPAERPVNRVVQGQTGTVTAVHEVNVKGDANGVGAAVGGVVGGLLGHQVGGGNGRTAMTVIGAVGGGLAGHEVQKRVNGTKVYNVTVQFDDGSSKTLRESSARGWRNGDRVRVKNGVITSENA
ncbi:hypothetical protein BH09PSE5_BH09PSE5_49550 [soil metagenome]